MVLPLSAFNVILYYVLCTYALCSPLRDCDCIMILFYFILFIHFWLLYFFFLCFAQTKMSLFIQFLYFLEILDSMKTSPLTMYNFDASYTIFISTVLRCSFDLFILWVSVTLSGAFDLSRTVQWFYAFMGLMWVITMRWGFLSLFRLLDCCSSRGQCCFVEISFFFLRWVQHSCLWSASVSINPFFENTVLFTPLKLAATRMSDTNSDGMCYSSDYDLVIEAPKDMDL